MQKYTYLIINLLSLAGPLALSFDKKVAFYKELKFLLPSISVIGIFFIVWDEIFTQQGVWGFNPHYITGIYVGNLPIEEILFFFTIPYACVFINACLEAYFPQAKQHSLPRWYVVFLGGALLVVSYLMHQFWYTFYTALFTGLFLLFLTLLKYRFSTIFFATYTISLIPFFVVNGLLTRFPVVWYNNNHNLGIRIATIPLEDFLYGFLLIVSNLVLFVGLKKIGGSKS